MLCRLLVAVEDDEKTDESHLYKGGEVEGRDGVFWGNFGSKNMSIFGQFQLVFESK